MGATIWCALSRYGPPGEWITAFFETRLIRRWLQIENCQVTANVKTVRKDKTEYHAVQVAASDRPDRTTTKAMRGHFAKAKVPSKYIVKEFPITADAHMPVGMFVCCINARASCLHLYLGTTLSAVHFVPGQYVDVIAKSFVFNKLTRSGRA